MLSLRQNPSAAARVGRLAPAVWLWGTLSVSAAHAQPAVRADSGQPSPGSAASCPGRPAPAQAGAIRVSPAIGATAASALRHAARRIVQQWAERREWTASGDLGRRTASANRPGQSPAPAADGSSQPQTGPVSGYMDFHYNNRQHEDAVLDFHRFVLLFSHGFSDRVRFVAELEIEHAVVSDETDGELELEQAYVDFLISRGFNVRAGMLLAPVGIINERHEPPVFYGVERPFVDTVIIPTTWFDAGVGVHGELGRGLRYRIYAMAPLDASGFSAADGLRGGRQKGAESNARRLAGAGRVEYVGTPGLVLGGSVWSGATGFSTPRIDTGLTLIEFDGRYRIGELEARGQYAHGFLDGMEQLNRSVQRTTGVSPNVAEEIRGFYLEGSYFILPYPAPRELAAFLRYENFDTQFDMPAGLHPLEQFDRDAWVFGLTYFPDPDVAVKIDYTVLRSQSAAIVAPDALNLGLGWWF